MEKLNLKIVVFIHLAFGLHNAFCQLGSNECTPNLFYCGRDLKDQGYKSAIADHLYKCTSDKIGQPFWFCDKGCTKNAANAAFCKCQSNLSYCGYQLLRMGWGGKNNTDIPLLAEHKIYECVNNDQIKYKSSCASNECVEESSGSYCRTDKFLNCTDNKKYCGYELSRIGYDILNHHALHICEKGIAFTEDDCYNGCIVNNGQSLCDETPKTALSSSAMRGTFSEPSSRGVQICKQNTYYCKDHLVSSDLSNLNSKTIYRCEAEGHLHPFTKCNHKCIQTISRTFCQPNCEQNSFYCGKQLKQDFEVYDDLKIIDDALYRCSGNGTWLTLIKICDGRCALGISQPFCSNLNIDTPHQRNISQSDMTKISLQKGRGTVRFSFLPFSQLISSYSIYLGPDIVLTIEDREVSISGKGASYFTRSELKYPESKLLHFNATEQIVWISICNRQPFIKIGYGYMMDVNTLFFFGTEHKGAISEVMKPMTFLGFNKSSSVFFTPPEFITVDPVIVDPAPVVADTINKFGRHGQHTILISSKLPQRGKELYDEIKASDLTESYDGMIDAINYSLDMDGCALNRKLKSKNTFGRGNSKTSYIRVTMGPDQCTSPGVSYVLEIWPKGHNSPIHNHGNTVAVIKILHGSLKSVWYNPLANVSYEKPQVIREQYFYKGNITWISPDYYQTHQLFNEGDDTAAISIQSYGYITGDDIQEETFNYILPDDSHLHFFKPNSDYEYRDFRRIVEEEHRTQTCSPSS